MFLSELIIVNYKSCRLLEVPFFKDEPTIFIGINDSGKSTILNAIGLLLQSNPTFSYTKESRAKEDISNTKCITTELNALLNNKKLPYIEYSERECLILGKFLIEVGDIPEDNPMGYSNHILWAAENANENEIWIARIFDPNNQKPKHLLLSPDKKDDPITLYKEKQAILTKYRNELKVTNEEVSNANAAGRFKNLEVFRAIYRKLELTYQWSDYKLDEGLFPDYSYLDWNISLTQLNEITTKVMNEKIAVHLDPVKRFALRKADKASQEVNNSLLEISATLRADVPNITALESNVFFEVKSALTDLLVRKANADGLIHIDNQGDGVKRQIWFSILKWKSLSAIAENTVNKKFLWCFDEPETHLFPSAQREFFDVIKRISKSNVQTAISTHSTVFIDRAKIDHIKSVFTTDGYTLFTSCTSIDDIYNSLQIKNSDFLFFNKFLVVEGSTEQTIIPHLYKKYTGSSLLEHSIQLINLQGKDNRIQNKHTLESILKEFKKETDNVIYLFDNDANYDSRANELNQGQVYFLGIQDIEDSISVSVWVQFLNEYLLAHEETINVTEEEISQIYKDILAEKINANQKFYPKVQALIKGKIFQQKDERYEILPSKGTDLGSALLPYLTGINLINGQIKEAFDKLKQV